MRGLQSSDWWLQQTKGRAPACTCSVLNGCLQVSRGRRCLMGRRILRHCSHWPCFLGSNGGGILTGED